MHRYLIFLFTLGALLTTSCKDASTLQISTTTISLSAETGLATFKIVCANEWKIKSNDDWCTVVASGIGNQTVEVRAEVYNGVSNRETTLTITNGEETKTIIVTQLGVELSLDAQTLNFPAEGGTQVLKLLTDNFSWTIDALSTPSFSIDPMFGNGNKDLIIVVSENTTDKTKTELVTLHYKNKIKQFTIHQAKWVKPENLNTVTEITSCDTTFAKINEIMSASVNWKQPFSNEVALLKISAAEQKNLLLTAKNNNNGKDLALYISAVQVWAATTAQYAAIVYKGDQNTFRETSRAELVSEVVTGNAWHKLNLKLSHPCEITGAEDLFVGAHVSNAVMGSFPFVVLSNNPKFPGRTAKYPSYGVCPDVEKYLQELNDPNDARWNTWVKNTNWAMKLVLSTEIRTN